MCYLVLRPPAPCSRDSMDMDDDSEDAITIEYEPQDADADGPLNAIVVLRWRAREWRRRPTPRTAAGLSPATLERLLERFDQADKTEERERLRTDRKKRKEAARGNARRTRQRLADQGQQERDAGSACTRMHELSRVNARAAEAGERSRQELHTIVSSPSHPLALTSRARRSPNAAIRENTDAPAGPFDGVVSGHH
jgi:hypothetical protein